MVSISLVNAKGPQYHNYDNNDDYKIVETLRIKMTPICEVTIFGI